MTVTCCTFLGPLSPPGERAVAQWMASGFVGPVTSPDSERGPTCFPKRAQRSRPRPACRRFSVPRPERRAEERDVVRPSRFAMTVPLAFIVSLGEPLIDSERGVAGLTRSRRCRK